MSPTALDPAAARRALDRFAAHRLALARNGPLRELYRRWYLDVAAALPARALGPRIEVGAGPGLSQSFVPDLLLTDVVAAPWHALRLSGEALPFAAASLGAVVCFDVLHHLPAPARFLAEAQRALVPGGRVVLCEPWLSPLSYPIYRWLHEEGLDTSVDPLEAANPRAGDPFAGNQAVPWLLFGRRSAELASRFPQLRMISCRRLAGPSYPLTGGFARPPLLPPRLWSAWLAAEDLLPTRWMAALAFRALVVLERTE